MSIKAHVGKQKYLHLAAVERRVKKFRQESFARLRAGSPALPGGSHAAERGGVWCRRWQGAVMVADFGSYSMEIVQFLLVRAVNPVKN